MNAPINRNADRGGAMSTRTTAAPRAPTARLRVPLRPRPRPHRRRGIVGPTLLIASGSLLLLNTTGLVGWDVWAVLWRLWPVIPSPSASTSSSAGGCWPAFGHRRGRAAGRPRRRGLGCGGRDACCWTGDDCAAARRADRC